MRIMKGWCATRGLMAKWGIAAEDRQTLLKAMEKDGGQAEPVRNFQFMLADAPFRGVSTGTGICGCMRGTCR